MLARYMHVDRRHIEHPSLACAPMNTQRYKQTELHNRFMAYLGCVCDIITMQISKTLQSEFGLLCSVNVFATSTLSQRNRN